MYDFLGKVKGISDTTSDMWKEIHLEGCCDDAAGSNVIGIRVRAERINDNGVKVGDWVKIRFSLEGRRYQERIFTNVVCKKLKVLVSQIEQEEEKEGSEDIDEEPQF